MIVTNLQTYSLLFAASFGYAALLNTSEGRRFADDHTAESVAIGVALVLAALRFLLPLSVWRLVALAFAVAGVPIVGRSLVNRAYRPGVS